jgi:hypothetical protein
MVLNQQCTDVESIVQAQLDAYNARDFPDGTGNVDVIAIYQVDNGKIAKAWFKIGERVLDAKA